VFPLVRPTSNHVPYVIAISKKFPEPKYSNLKITGWSILTLNKWSKTSGTFQLDILIVLRELMPNSKV
jgi:hypothetical protein